MNNEMKDITNLLPHRDPFLFVDRLVSVDEDGCTAEYVFTGEEYFFKGHFPEYPIVPGVLLVEMMAQCGGAGLKAHGVLSSDSLFFLGSVEKAKFRTQVRPGDVAMVEVKNLRVSNAMIRQRGTVTVHGKLAAEATWMCLVGTQQ